MSLVSSKNTNNQGSVVSAVVCGYSTTRCTLVFYPRVPFRHRINSVFAVTVIECTGSPKMILENPRQRRDDVSPTEGYNWNDFRGI